MLKFFRRIRKNLLSDLPAGKAGSRMSKYLIYATGEIFLVMIGILLAMQVNNWNEERKSRVELDNILRTVAADLKEDTAQCSLIIQEYDTINSYSRKVIANEFNAKNIDDCIHCRKLVTNYNPIEIQRKGYKLLQNYAATNTDENDTLVASLSIFYNTFESLISSNNEIVKEESLNNFDYFKSQSWFIPWTQGHMTDPMREYFGESLDYKNRVASYNILANDNHNKFIKLYYENAIKLLEDLEARVGK